MLCVKCGYWGPALLDVYDARLFRQGETRVGACGECLKVGRVELGLNTAESPGLAEKVGAAIEALGYEKHKTARFTPEGRPYDVEIEK